MIHSSSVIDKNAKIGKDVKIGPFCYIGPQVEIGSNVNLVSNINYSLVFFISPKKINKIIDLIKKYFFNRNILICREITKFHEEYLRSSVKNLSEVSISTKGEVTVVISEDINLKKNLLN